MKLTGIPFRILLLVLLCCCGISNIQSQLVNIESRRMHTDSIRFVLSSDLLFNYTDNNGEYIVQISSNSNIQYKSKNLKNIYFLTGNLNLIRTKDEDFQNSWFAHFRYNWKFSDKLRAESFIQSQNNQQLIITQRDLAGIGLRFKMFNLKNTTAYLGNSYMYEIEYIKSLDEHFYNHRNSSYLSISQSFSNHNLTILGTLYFQPLYKKMDNYRILGQLKVEMPLSEIISFSGQLNYSLIKFDSVLGDDRSTNTSFGFTINI